MDEPSRRRFEHREHSSVRDFDIWESELGKPDWPFRESRSWRLAGQELWHVETEEDASGGFRVRRSARGAGGQDESGTGSEVVARLQEWRARLEERSQRQEGPRRESEIVELLHSHPHWQRLGRSDRVGVVRDLGLVWDRLEDLYSSRQARIWLTSHNATIGARPLDALIQRGLHPVVVALEREEQLGY